MIRSLGRTLVILVLAVAVGLGAARYRGLALVPDVEQINHLEQQRQQWIQRTAITLDQLRQHCELGYPIIDARSRYDFEDGHLDAVLIMNVPAGEAHEHFVRIAPLRGQPIVIYCSSEDCEDAWTLWSVMHEAWQFGDEVRVFHPGWDGICASQLPVAAGPDPGADLPFMNGQEGAVFPDEVTSPAQAPPDEQTGAPHSDQPDPPAENPGDGE